MSSARAMSEQFVTAVNDRDGTSAWSMLHDDVVVCIAGTTALSGPYNGRSQIENVLIGEWRERVASVRFDPLEWFDSDGTVALLVRPSGYLTRGKPLNAGATIMGVVLEVRGNHVISIRLFPDTKTIETELYGATYMPRRRTVRAAV